MLYNSLQASSQSGLSLIDINIPGYRIVKTLGKGGMATVYLAIQESFQRKVALKVMSAHLSQDESFSERFLREARIVSQLVHPNIVTVHDVGMHEGHHYLSMEYIPGNDLKKELGNLSAQRLLELMKELAKALDYSGRKGYIHRDVKPENIMLHAEDGRAVLMDFGIARAADHASSMTQTGTAIGTPHYMSPEQARGKAVDLRSDLYSLGVVFYWALTGAVPYDGDSAVSIGIKHISEAVPQLPAPLASMQPIINKLLAKAPDDRFQSGTDFITALAKVNPRLIDTWWKQRGNQAEGTAQSTPAPGASLDLEDIQPEETLHVPQDVISERSQPVPKRPPVGLMLSAVVLAALAGGYIHLFGTQIPPAEEELQAARIRFGLLEAPLEVAAVEPAPVSEPVAEAPVPEAGPDALPAEPAAVVVDPVVEVSHVDQLVAQSRELSVVLESEPERIDELVAVYREILALEAEHPEAVAGLAMIKAEMLDWTASQLAMANLGQAQQGLASTEAWFPAVAEEAEFQTLQKQLQALTAISDQLATADGYLAKDQLTKPRGENARDAYQQVLAWDPGNEQAKRGLATIAQRYAELATRSAAQGDWQKVQSQVASGLAIAPSHQKLVQLKAEAEKQQATEDAIRVLLAQAQQLEQQQQWFGGSDSAAYHYQQVLAIEVDHEAARAGIDRLLSGLAGQVTGLLEAKDFVGARAALAPAQQQFPDDLQLETLADDILSRAPKVHSLNLGGDVAAAASADSEAVAADRSLLISFSYNNFYQSTTVLQAVLYDGSRAVQIAAVPVVVTGDQGETQFQIVRAVEGFTEGGYHLDIELNSEPVLTYSFVIVN